LQQDLSFKERPTYTLRTMDISGFLDFVDNFLSQTTYSTEILIGIGFLALVFFFVSAREFHYRYLKKISQSPRPSQDLDFIEEKPRVSKPLSSPAPKFPLS
jgi:hypothetical protein